MLLNFNQNEQVLLHALLSKFKPSLDKAFTLFSEAQAQFEKLDDDAQKGKRTLTDDEAKTVAEYEKTQTEYSRLLAEYEEKREIITSKAEEREDIIYYWCIIFSISPMISPNSIMISPMISPKLGG